MNLFKKALTNIERITCINMKINIEFFQTDFIKAIGAGVYEISVVKNAKSDVLYIGESVFVLIRCATHLYELKKNPNYFGFTKNTIDDSSITLRFTFVAQDSNKITRKQLEKILIAEKKPLSQSGISDYQKNIEGKIEALTQFLNIT